MRITIGTFILLLGASMPLLASPVAAGLRAPLSFEANLGQTSPTVQMLARAPGVNLFLTANGVTAQLEGPAGTAHVDLTLVGAASLQWQGERPTARRSHYLLGDDPAQWTTDVPHFDRTVCHDAYPGIDLVFYSRGGELEYDFVARPGADVECIGLGFAGVERTEIDAQGDLLLHLEHGCWRQRRPVAHEQSNHGKEVVEASYWLDVDGIVRFRVERRDPNATLVIDPILVYSTFLGGTAGDLIQGIAVDRFGSAHVTGFTTSSDFPTRSALQEKPAVAGAVTAFVTKFTPTGRDVVFSTYLGGNGTSWGKSIALLRTGEILLSGWTDAPKFPVKDSFQKAAGGGFDAFLTALTPGGNALTFSTLWGGRGDERAEAMALAPNGEIHLAGETQSSDLPLVAPFDSTLGGPSDAFVLKIKPSLSAVLYATYLGGSGADKARGIAASVDNEAFLTGETRSTDFPTQSALQTKLLGFSDAFVTRLKVDGQAIAFSTYLGGGGTDDGWAITVDAGRNAHVTGRASGGFPLKNSLYAAQGNTLLFLTKLQPNGLASVFSTLLAANVNGIPQAIALTPGGDIYVGGSVVYLGDGVSEFPSRGPALQRSYGGGSSDGFIVRVDATGTFFDYASFLGGSQGDEVTSLAVGEKEEVYVAGLTTSTDFPTTVGAFDRSHGGQNDGFVARLDTFSYPDDPPYLTLGQPATFPLTAVTPFVRRRFIVPPGMRAIVTVTDPDALDWNVVYARYNAEAQPYRFDHAAEERGRANQRLVIPETQVGECYLRVMTNKINGPSSTVTILVEAVDFALESVAPRRATVGSRFHASVRGAGFRSDASFTIARQSGGPTISAQEVLVTSPTRAEMIFDLTGQSPGVYRLKGFNPLAASGGLDDALVVVPADLPAMLDTRLSARDTVRRNRVSRLTVHYENVGDLEAPAPLLRVRAPAGVELRFEDETAFQGSTLDFIAINPDGPAGILLPGARGSMPLVFRSNVNGPVELTVNELTATAADTIAWNTLAAPSGWTAAEWNVLRTQLGSILGSSWESYRDALGEVATRLVRRGVDGSRAFSLRELFRQAVLAARGTFPGAAVVGRVLRSPSNSPLAGAAIVALEGNVVRSSTITDAEGRFGLGCLAAGVEYSIRMPTHTLSSSTSIIPANGGDLFGADLRAIEATNNVTPIPSACDAHVLPGRALEAPQSLFTPRHALSVSIVASEDPNEKDGPEGEGPLRTISIQDEILYTIHFENIGSAPAQVVTVTDQLEQDLDFSSFRMLEAGVGNQVISLDVTASSTPEARDGYSGRRIQGSVRTGTPYSGVEVRCEFNALTGLGTWTFETVNPTTGERAPDLPTEGFLPANTADVRPAGEGWISFSLYPRPALAEGTDIENEGSIIFDEPQNRVDTPPIRNTVTLGQFTLRAPRNPFPANSTQRFVPLPGLYLGWEGDPRTSTYDVRFWKDGEARPGTQQATALTAPFYVPERNLEANGLYHWEVTARVGNQAAASSRWSFRTEADVTIAGQFLRGDANADGQRDISDASYILSFLFLGGSPPTCFDSADSNDDGSVNISDPSALLGHLFLGTFVTLPRPFTSCGQDPTADALTCLRYTPCE